LIPVDRVAADRPFYRGKHRKHVMNLQVIAGLGGDIVGVPGPLPGPVHDLTTARIWGIIRELAPSGLVPPGDKGYIGEDDIRTPRRERNQARLAERRQPGSCPAEELADRAEASLLPRARRATGQSHLRPSRPRNRRTKTVQGSMTVPVLTTCELP
jgi:hypothetical protein